MTGRPDEEQRLQDLAWLRKFKARYATLGFNDAANLDDGAMSPTEFALKKLAAGEEKKIAALINTAVS